MADGTVTLWTKWLVFEAAHSLDFLPDGHKCKRLHGHTWHVRFEVGAPPNARPTQFNDENVAASDFIVDYADLTNAWQEQVHKVIDHRFLNEISGLDKPTTERLSKWIAERLQAALPLVELITVRVREGEGGEAVWRR